MTCREFLPLINDLTDGCLNGNSEKKIRDHLTDCRDCSGELKRTKNLKSLLKKFAKPNPGRKYYVAATAKILNRVAGANQSGHFVN